jgi:hypothetical protein
VDPTSALLYWNHDAEGYGGLWRGALFPLYSHSWRYGALAEFERSLIRERTQAGLTAARRLGHTGGQPPKLTDDDIKAAKTLLANPDIGVTQIARRLGVCPATLYRYIPAARTANAPKFETRFVIYDQNRQSSPPAVNGSMIGARPYNGINSPLLKLPSYRNRLTFCVVKLVQRQIPDRGA